VISQIVFIILCWNAQDLFGLVLSSDAKYTNKMSSI